MKRQKILLSVSMVFLIGATANAQQAQPAPQQRGAAPVDVLNLPVLQQGGQQGGLTARRVRVNTDGAAGIGYGQALSLSNGAWWTNTALLTRLGLTDDQKLRIERVYESHRQNLVSSKDALEKEEAQLSKLLEADPLDRTASVAQIYKVVQARGEMEKTNSLMTLEMREVLTRPQWTQLQAQQAAIGPWVISNQGPAVNTGARGGGVGRGVRGQ